jgi:predicted nuclease with TOPRIM domain
VSDTPKTDRWEWEQECNYDVPWEEHCRELERENAELKKQANDEFDTVITRNMELVRENGRLRMALDASCNAEELRQVRAENAALRNKLAMYEGQTRFLCQCGGTKP